MRRPQNLKKNLTPVLTKQLFLLSRVVFLQIFVSLSEKLNFKIRNYEKATKFEKKSPIWFDKTAVSTQ